MTRVTPIRIVLGPIDSPLTIGMSGLAIASLVERPGLGLAPYRAPFQVGLILLVVPLVLGPPVSIFSYLGRGPAPLLAYSRGRGRRSG